MTPTRRLPLHLKDVSLTRRGHHDSTSPVPVERASCETPATILGNSGTWRWGPRVGIDSDTNPATVRGQARVLGLRLELERLDGNLTIVAYEIQTGVRITDLPGMNASGHWRSWEESFKGLKELS